jgi:hypothetical protein
MLDSSANVPTIAQVAALIGEEESESPSRVLKQLTARGHTRAEAQRGIQRALDADRIELDNHLRLKQRAP